MLGMLLCRSRCTALSRHSQPLLEQVTKRTWLRFLSVSMVLPFALLACVASGPSGHINCPWKWLLVFVPVCPGVCGDCGSGSNTSQPWMISDTRMQRERASAQAALYHLARAALQSYQHLPDSRKHLLVPVRHVSQHCRRHLHVCSHAHLQ